MHREGVRRKSQGERDDPDMDGEKLKGEVVVVNRDGKERLGREEHVPVPKRRVHITRENLDNFGFTARCLGFMSLLRRDGTTGTHRGPKKWKQRRRARPRQTWPQDKRR